jgi:hypothetical protein
MKTHAEIISDARESRAALAKSLQRLRRRLNPPELANDALAMLDPQLKFLGRAFAGIKRHPLLAAALVAGAGWVVSGASSRGGLLHARSRKKTLNNTNNHKGDEQ